MKKDLTIRCKNVEAISPRHELQIRGVIWKRKNQSSVEFYLYLIVLTPLQEVKPLRPKGLLGVEESARETLLRSKNQKKKVIKSTVDSD